MSIWHKSSTWEKVQLSINVLLSMTQGALIFKDSEHIWNYLVLAGQIIGALIGVWMVDHNKNGKPDIFEKEVTTTISSASPMTVTTEETTKQ